MKQNILPAVKLTAICLLFFSGFYTLLILGIAQLAPNSGKGEMILSGQKKYYANVGQKFSSDSYFWSRPSAGDYNAAGAGGSNKGPSNPEYLKTVQDRIDHFVQHNPGIRRADIPSDLVTASGSGLDPDISVQSAEIQIRRISKIRNITERNLKKMIIDHTEAPMLGIFGTEKINVLKLNIALENPK